MFYCDVFMKTNCDLPYVVLRSLIAINNCVALRDDEKEVLFKL